MRYRTVFLCFLAAASCTAPRRNLNPGPKEQPTAATGSRQGFALVLHNRNYLDVNIFVQHDGQASRVGTVTGSSSTAVEVPGWMMGEGGLVRLIAEPIGDNSRYVTDAVLIQPGQLVELTVESVIARSNYSVQ